MKVKIAGDKEEVEGDKPTPAPAPSSVPAPAAAASDDQEGGDRGEEGDVDSEKKRALKKKIAAQSMQSGGFRMPSAT